MNFADNSRNCRRVLILISGEFQLIVAVLLRMTRISSSFFPIHEQ